MAGITTLLYYQLYFDDVAVGAAAQAANGGDIDLPIAPETALATYAGGVILQTGSPFFSAVPGVVDLGGYTPTLGTPGIVHVPRYVLTSDRSTVVTETVYGAGLDIQQVNTVTYLWDGTIAYTHQSIAPTPGAVSGKYEQQVVTWIGDGSSNRLIPTTFALDSGVVAIWGCGGAEGSGASDANFFRHNTATMAGTAVMGILTDPFTTQGIMTFEAGGFRVTVGASSLLFANTLNCKYVAIVLRDTTSDNRYLRVGTYIGLASGTLNGVITIMGSSTYTYFGGAQFDPLFEGLLMTDVHGVTYTFHYISATVASISPSYQNIPANPVSFVFLPGQRTITVPGRADTLTHLWVWGSTVAYRSFEFPGISSATLVSGANGHNPVDTMITGLGSRSFTVVDAAGPNQSVNTFLRKYDYLALNADAAFLALRLFASTTGVGAGAPPTVIGLPFTPDVAFARQGGSTFTEGGIWRGPQSTGTNSNRCSQPGGSNNLSNGITAIGASSVDLGIGAAPVGDPTYVWIFKGGSSPAFTPTYTRNPDPPAPPSPPPSGPPPQPAACVVPILDTLNTVLCAAPAPLFP